MRQLWDGITAQFCVTTRSSRRAIGLVGLYNSNLVSGYCYLYAISCPESIGSGAVMKGVLEMIGYGFQSFRFRKIYLDDDDLFA